MAILTKREVWRKPKALGPQRYTPDLTDDEQAHVRRALEVLGRRFGSRRAAAAAMGVKLATLDNAAARRRPSVGLALRAARLAGVTVEDILSGAWPKAGACPMCGRTDAAVPELPAARR